MSLCSYIKSVHTITKGNSGVSLYSFRCIIKPGLPVSFDLKIHMNIQHNLPLAVTVSLYRFIYRTEFVGRTEENSWQNRTENNVQVTLTFATTREVTN